MGLRVSKEVNRMPGYTPQASNNILEGHVVELENNELALWDGTGEPVGIAGDSNVMYPLQNTGTNPTAGTGYDYPNFNRGGLISVFLNGGVFEVFDDGRGHVVDTAQAYAQGGILYADNTTPGRLTSVVGTNYRVGRIIGVTGSGATVRVTFVLEL